MNWEQFEIERKCPDGRTTALDRFHRCAIFGGWLLRAGDSSVTYIRDPDHQWDLARTYPEGLYKS